MEKLIINGEGIVFGRLCSLIAKKALEGDEVSIINSEKVIITGRKQDIIKKYQVRRARGGKSRKGPHYPKSACMILKRGIRGMLPNYREGIGRDAFKRVKCYEGVPKEFEGKKTLKVEAIKHDNFIELKELSERL